MNLRRGPPIPRENEGMQNGNIWIPSTPDKPRSNNSQPENWRDLVGIYTGVLQNGQSQNLNLNSTASPSPNIECVIAPGEACNKMLQPSSNKISQTVNNQILNLRTGIQDFRAVQKLALSYDHQENATSQNYVEVATPRKVNSLAELMGTAPSGSTGIGSCNLQETTNSSLSVRNYNLNLPPRPETNESPFEPVTPAPQRQSQELNASTDGIEKCAQKNGFVSSPLPDIPTRGHSEILLTTPSENGGIDLNQTPQQKPPRKKKHRPKVIREGKPKRTPKPAAGAKTKTPDGNSKLKKKYVRKNGINASDTPSPNAVNTIETSNGGIEHGPTKKSKSCKRKLNFDPEIGAKRVSRDGGVQDSQGGHKRTFNLNLEADYTDCSTEQSTGNNKVAPHEDSLALVSVAPPKKHPLNVIARILNKRNSSANPSTHVHHCISEGLAPRIFHSNPYTTIQPTAHNMPPRLAAVTEIQGAETRHPHAITLMGSQLWSSNEVSDVGRYNRDNSGLDTYRKTKVDNKFHGTSSSSTPSGVATIEDFSAKIGSRSKNLQISECANSEIRGHSISGSPIDTSKELTRGWCMDYPDLRPKVHQQHVSSRVGLSSEQVASPKTSMSLTVVTNRNKGSVPMSQQTPSANGPVVDKRLVLVPRNRRNNENPSKKLAGLQELKMAYVDYITNLLKGLNIGNEKEQSFLEGDGSVVPYKGDTAAVPYKGDTPAVPYKEDTAAVPYKEDGAVVPYKANNAVVPYEEFDPVKRRRPRPRVDLDPETNRIWNLLMGKEGSESAEPMDASKQKWWEDERKVFRGRVDSFIARMHLVQGDRRFSKWKGSVVDSVIGVFLTQNVSDHLSSSAFMSLAARFPLKPSTVNGGSEHHEVRITYPDGTTYKQNIPREPADNHSTVTSTESSHTVKNGTTEKSTDLGNCNTNKTEGDIISSQSSSESFVFQAFEDIRSSSGSNSEGDDVLNLGKSLGFLSEPHGGVMGSYKELLLGQNQVPSAPATCHQDSALPSTSYSSGGLEKWEEDILGFSGNESISTLASTVFEISNRKGVNPTHEFAGIENQIHTFQPMPENHPIRNEHPELKTDSRDKSGKRIGEETFQKENTSLSDSTKPAEAFGKQPSGTANSSEEHVNNIDNTGQNSRKRKAEKEKVEVVDWDILRKQVQSKCGTRERCRDTMDSLDYEALRNAHVSEISEAIKERGMKNMLAERMKSFLNRVVQDHERIDLEWLRDVDPDKVQDYLLSMRGLGLKSVECVRLLTLHHMAFPVDTNVGRIAVRLGWVPLQPLPESLQLHLLELYPVLDTIQKYLWPRLCKLDQETLYELHYQMITFGKVFCTKREPNCNACPMRGECRHFASAVANARLVLPGPEEKRVVASAVAPATPNKESGAVFKPLLLNSSEGNRGGGISGSTRNREPLIEEPSSPEPPIEVSERDIEDAFYEDPDEIPTIKLNVQEFTANLQSFMQEQMESGEVDMSKALVALSPDFASLPIPKLKHVSRLRTEHQVYELPDSHPLLKEMDRREPDDPSPYLLAIWTPGETADSIQPPESTCSSQKGGGGGGGLCDNETCFSCNSSREAQSQTVRGTILVPCRTAMRGSFPLNGTYFQVNEVFADNESSLEPIEVPRRLLWNLPRRTVYFGSSVTSIFKGLTTEGIQYCFWKGFVCVRGFDQKTRAPKPLKARLHIPAASRAPKKNE